MERSDTMLDDHIKKNLIIPKNYHVEVIGFEDLEEDAKRLSYESKVKVKAEEKRKLNQSKQNIEEGQQKKILDAQKESPKKHEDQKNPLSFFDEEEYEFELEKEINSDEFIKRSTSLIESVDYKFNLEYLRDLQENHNIEAYELLAIANVGLVNKLVSRYAKLATPGIDKDDMFQIGMQGLMRAAEKFDPSMGNEFSTYAMLWIRQSISRGIADYGTTIRIPVHLREQINKISRLEKESFQTLGFIDEEWITNKAEISKNKYENLIMVRNTYLKPISMDTPVGVDGDTTFSEFVGDEQPLPDELIITKELSEKIEFVLKTLTDREANIIRLRFGLIDGQSRTLEQIGQMLGVTRERIRQIESKALRRLRHHTRTVHIKDFLIR